MKDETSALIAKHMKDGLTAMNRVKISDFTKFIPLFDKTIRTENIEDRGAVDTLIKEFYSTFSPYNPIEIISDDGSVVLETLPPVQVQVPAMNLTVKKSGELVQTFSNILKNKDQSAKKKDGIAQTLGKAMHHAIQNDPAFEIKKKEALKITEDFDKGKGKPVTTKQKEVVKPKTDGMEWE